MKLKKSIFILLITVILVLSIILLLIIPRTNTKSPDGTVKYLFSTLKDYDKEKMSSVLTQFPNTYECNLTYDLFTQTNYVSLFQKSYGDAKFSIENINENDDTHTTVTVKATIPDLPTAYSSAMYAVAIRAFSDEELYNLIQDENADVSGYIPEEIISMYDDGKIQSTETTFTLSLQKQDDGSWKISTDDDAKNLISYNLYNTVSALTSEDN